MSDEFALPPEKGTKRYDVGQVVTTRNGPILVTEKSDRFYKGVDLDGLYYGTIDDSDIQPFLPGDIVQIEGVKDWNGNDKFRVQMLNEERFLAEGPDGKTFPAWARFWRMQGLQGAYNEKNIKLVSPVKRPEPENFKLALERLKDDTRGASGDKVLSHMKDVERTEQGAQMRLDQ
jgi:hypothetical protein